MARTRSIDLLRSRGRHSDREAMLDEAHAIPDRGRSPEDAGRDAEESRRVRRLFVDPASDRVTMLVKMDAGTSYPAHRHGGVEECFVLEGDLYGPDFEMKAGDYQRLTRGSTHGVQGTRAGCLLFIVSSMNDELLPKHV